MSIVTDVVVGREMADRWTKTLSVELDIDEFALAVAHIYQNDPMQALALVRSAFACGVRDGRQLLKCILLTNKDRER